MVCAVLDLPFRKFWPPVIVAALVYTGAWLATGFLFGPAVIETLEQIVIPVGLLVRVGATTVVNALMYLARPLAQRLLTSSGTIIALVSPFPADRFGASLSDWQHGLLFAVLPLALGLTYPIFTGAQSDPQWVPER